MFCIQVWFWVYTIYPLLCIQVYGSEYILSTPCSAFKYDSEYIISTPCSAFRYDSDYMSTPCSAFRYDSEYILSTPCSAFRYDSEYMSTPCSAFRYDSEYILSRYLPRLFIKIVPFLYVFVFIYWCRATDSKMVTFRPYYFKWFTPKWEVLIESDSLKNGSSQIGVNRSQFGVIRSKMEAPNLE